MLLVDQGLLRLAACRLVLKAIGNGRYLLHAGFIPQVDGRPLLVRKGYNTIVRNAGRFIGHWADVTPLVKPGAQQTLTLQLPGQKPLGVFFDNVETILTDSFASTA